MKLSVAIAGQEAMPNAFVVFRGVKESIIKAHALGYDGVELALKRPDEVTRTELAQWLGENHLEVSAISSGQVFAARNLYFTDENTEHRAELYKTFCDFIDLASEFGSLVNIGRTRGPIAGRDQALVERLFLDMAHKVADHAEKRGVDLILEPVNRYEIDFINNLDECAALLKKVNRRNFVMMPDVFHMNIEDDRIGESFIRNKEYVRYVHFADTNRHAPGDGHMNWDEIFHALEEIGYTGWTTAEILPYPDPDTAAKRTVDFLRETYGSFYR
ncbi:sugar phosphate isomerase/epimerase family protein [Sphaerochaeta sp.]|jgi:sugar phosphate isomerase/epimerase|uniref:sugar phosphate isomerase/epimerase family protein n=1 Tax=Sphaerochaeta sp. TaxID=1972642 RepID=UPI002FC9B428